jgi:hypothetical protein
MLCAWDYVNKRNRHTGCYHNALKFTDVSYPSQSIAYSWIKGANDCLFVRTGLIDSCELTRRWVQCFCHVGSF